MITALVVKGSILMIAAAGVVALMHRASAATRHFAWTLTVVGLLLLPVVSMAPPTWSIAVPIAPAVPNLAVNLATDASATMPLARREPVVATDIANDLPSRTDRDNVPFALLATAIYALGVLVLLLRIVVQRSTGKRIVREAMLVADVEWASLLKDCAARTGVRRHVALRRSRTQLMPMTIGTLAPAIVIPADADTWDADRRRAVLLHELAHIARHDCLTQIVSAVACALYWVHPGVWYVARRLRVERELASDDRVLAAGAQASHYAGHLLELAYSWSGRRAPALVVGMASSRKLEGRMRALLDPARNRTVPSRRAWLAGAALSAVVLLAIATLSLTTTTASNEVDAADEALDAQADDRSASAQDATSGTWEITRARTPGRVSIRLRHGDSTMRTDVDQDTLDRFAQQPLSTANGPIRVSIAREAGTFEIEGDIRSGAGSGTFRFVPSQTFITRLSGRGFDRPTPAQLMALAQHDIGAAFIDELAAQKYAQPHISELVRAAHHGVDMDFLKRIGNAGYRVGTLEALIRFRDHGVTPEYIRELNAQGVRDLLPEDLVRARDHGIDPDYVSAMRQAGYRPGIFDLIRARDHGVTPDYVAALRESGYSSPDLDDVIRARDHGVDRNYLRDMRELGFTVTISQLINARDHGVTPDYVVALGVRGYKNLSLDSLIRLRDNGVTPEFVLEVQKLRGIDKPSVDELIRLRHRGVASADNDATRLARLEAKLTRLIEKLLWKSEKLVDKAMRKVQS